MKSKYASLALAVFVSVFALAFCPCSKAAASDMTAVQKAAASDDHGCCSKTEPPCEKDSCAYSSLEIPSVLRAEYQSPILSNEIYLSFAFQDISHMPRLAISRIGDDEDVFLQLHPVRPPTYLLNSLLLI